MAGDLSEVAEVPLGCACGCLAAGVVVVAGGGPGAGPVLAPARVVALAELGRRPVFVDIVAQGQYRAADAGEQVRCCLIAITFATGYVSCGGDDRVAGAVRRVLSGTGRS